MMLPVWLSRLCMSIAALSIVVAVVFWSIYAAHGSSQLEMRQQIRASAPPLTVNGLRISFDGAYEADATSRVREPRAAGRRTLLLVTSDECHFCLKIVGTWESLVARLPIDHGDELVVASYKGSAIPQALATVAKRRGLHYRLLTIRQQPVFGTATGLTQTPTTVLLDADSRLRFVATTLDPTVEGMLFSEWVRLAVVKSIATAVLNAPVGELLTRQRENPD